MTVGGAESCVGEIGKKVRTFLTLKISRDIEKVRRVLTREEEPQTRLENMAQFTPIELARSSCHFVILPKSPCKYRVFWMTAGVTGASSLTGFCHSLRARCAAGSRPRSPAWQSRRRRQAGAERSRPSPGRRPPCRATGALGMACGLRGRRG